MSQASVVAKMLVTDSRGEVLLILMKPRVISMESVTRIELGISSGFFECQQSYLRDMIRAYQAATSIMLMVVGDEMCW